MPINPNPNLSTDLMSAAIEMLDQRGATDFSMKDLAAKVGYAVTAVYRCYKSKTHLLQAMQLRLFVELPLQFEAVSKETTDTKRIKALGAAFIKWSLLHPARYRFMFNSIEAAAILSDEDQETARSGLRVLEALIRNGTESGEFAVEDPGAAATILFATLHGLVSLHIAQRLDHEQIEDLSSFYENHVTTWFGRLLMPVELSP